MARSNFGGTTSDFVFSTFTLAGRGLLDLSAATLTFWSAATGGAQYTDLLLNGASVNSIQVGDDGQIPLFQGPDGITSLWVSSGDSLTPRVRMVAEGKQGPPGDKGAQGDPGPAVPADQLAALSGTIAEQVPPQVIATLAADNTPATAAATAVANAMAAQHTPTAQDLGVGSAWNFNVRYGGNDETIFGQRTDGSFFPTAKVETDLAAQRGDLTGTGWRWCVFYADNREVRFGERTDGTYYPASLGGGSQSTLQGMVFGDSLTAGWTSTIANLSTATGVTFSTDGVGGQISSEIAARQGGAPCLVTVSGNVIPASGSVSITLNKRIVSSTIGGRTVMINGVKGTFAATDATTFLTGTFTRTTPGVAVPVRANTPMQSGLSDRHKWPIFWAGANNPTDTAQVLADVKAMMAYTLDQEHALIFSMFPNATAAPLGSTTRTNQEVTNDALRDAFPEAYIDMAGMIRSTDIITAVGLTPSAQDSTDITNGVTPSSLRNDLGGGVRDPIHINSYGYAAITLLLAMTYRSKGWIS